MNRSVLFPFVLLGTAQLVRGQNTLLDSFRTLKPSESAAQQDAVRNVLAHTGDPTILLQAAQLFRSRCVDPPVNTLEYWGPDVETQAELRSSAELFLKLTEQAQSLAKSQADVVAEQMRNANDSPQVKRWEKLTAAAKFARNQQAFASYAQLLAAEPEERAAAAERAMLALKTEDLSHTTARPDVDLQLGKILIAAGQLEKARTLLLRVRDHSQDIGEQYQARYFLCVCEIESANVSSARASFTALVDWQAHNLPGNAGAEAAAAILQYRLDSVQADQSDSAAEKRRYNHSAIAAMEKLVRQQPALKPAVLEHLAGRYAAVNDLESAEPLILESIMHRGAGADADSHAQARAQRAADVVLHRAREFAPSTVDYAAALSAAILDRTGQNAAAAQAYVNLAQRIEHRDVKVAGAALDRAIQLFQGLPSDSEQQNFYAQALAMAIAPPFNRKNLLYADSQLLIKQEKYSAAIQVLREIPSNDPHYVDAELARVICARHLMDTQTLSARNQSAAEISSAVDQILRQTHGPSAIAARAILVDAEVCQLIHQPQNTLARLSALPERCQDLPEQQYLLDRAAELQIAALTQLHRPVEAANILAKTNGLISVPVSDLAKQLDAELEAAGDTEHRATVADARLQLASWLVDHARDSQPGDLAHYHLFYADALRRAGELTNDHVAKTRDLEKSLNEYQQLIGSAALGNSNLTPLLGEAAVQFDLENYAAAREIVLPLLNGGHLGDGQGPGADAYWEATYELLAANAALANHGHADTTQRQENVEYLKRLYIQWGDQIGGKHWHASFESLRHRLAPGWTPSAPALQP